VVEIEERLPVSTVNHVDAFDIYVTVHCVKFLKIKPTRCTNFSNLFLEWKSTCFGQFLCSSSGVFHCTLYTAVPSWSCSQTVSKPVWHITLLCVQWKTPDDGHRNCPKHVEFNSKNKFEKLLHLVGFIMRHVDALSNFQVQLHVPYHIYTKHGCTSSRHELRGDWGTFTEHIAHSFELLAKQTFHSGAVVAVDC